ncbi:hypothetical protein [Massilia genomosp. 1]|uniref:Uncharacterized protein n=1 Tax=Massilia genomosp. 1 TaxID=2609280 RepID=A0ABX0MVC7_9BURK|nr:hypothetical protein [Massilia genomosp. 1]NHZ66675.1 hypothetical protein [Massilia genomosp. 1]
MPLPAAVWVGIEVIAVVSAKVAAKKAAKELIKRQAKKEAERLAKEALKKQAEKELKEKVAEAAKKAAADAAKKAKAKSGAVPKANTAPKKHQGKQKQKLGKCDLRRYHPDTCKPLTGHHVVPDRVFRIGNEKTGVRIPGAISNNEGWVICVEGQNRSKTKAHGQIHALYDYAEAALGKVGKPVGTAELGKLEALGVAAAAKIANCNAVKMLAELRLKHQLDGLGPNMKVRADPWGSISKTLDPKKLGTGTVPLGKFTK